MLGGKPLFRGETISDTLAAVLTREVSWTAIPESTPAAVIGLLRRCLERDATQRLRDIGEARIALSGDWSHRGEQVTARRRRVVAAALGLAAIAAGALLGSAVGGRPPGSPPAAARSVVAVQPDGAVIRSPAVSPNGRAIAFESRGRLWLQRLDEWEPRELSGTEGGGSPFWSPDSRTVAFFTDRQLLRVSPDGGAVTPIATLTVSAGRAGTPYRSGGVWRSDGTILYTTEPGPAMEETTTDVFTTEFGPLYAVPAGGGTPRIAARPSEGVLDFHEPAALPGRLELAVSLHRATGRDALGILAPDGTVTILVERRGKELRRPVYSPTGHLLFHQVDGDATLQMNRSPSVWALPFSRERLDATGEPQLIDAGSWPSVAEDGTLVMVAPQAPLARQLGWFDRDGRLTSMIPPARDWREALSISPSGTRLLTADGDGIWMSDLNGSSRSRVTREPRDSMPVWIGERTLAFTREQNGVLSVVVKDTDLSAPERVVATPARYPTATRDGRYLMFNVLGDRPGSWQPAWIDLRGEPTLRPLGAAHLGARFPHVSPDGRFVAYVSAETGRDEVYVTQFPNGRDKWQVSESGGGWTSWGPASDEIFFRRGGRESALMVVSVAPGDTPRFSTPKLLFPWPEHWAPYYTFARDGRSGVTAVPIGPVHRIESLRVSRNWAPGDAGP